MKRFSKKGYGEEAICPSCGDWKTTDFSPAELKEREWECSDCMNKRLTNPQDLPENRGSKEVSKYDPEYEFLVKLIQLVTKEGVPPQEVKALAEAHPFVTIDDVGDLSAQIWTLATEKYHIPREWLIKKLPKNASLKTADLYPAQKETEDMINHAPGYIAYEYGQDKEADGEFKGSEFSGTDAGPNPLLDIGPWSSPEDHGKAPQKSPFPNTNWLPADDQNLDQQAPSNVAASLKKRAYDEGFWIDPSGKVYQVRNSETGFITHDEWIAQNQQMLADQYGIEITDDDLEYESPRDVNNMLISQGWTRIGDSGNADVGIRTMDLRKIPQVVEDTLYSFYNGGKIAIEDLSGKHVEINKLDQDLQKVVNHSLSRSGSLKKEALQQQDVVDFYLLSLLPAEYLNKEVGPDHYDALAIFKSIIQSLRDEYIERGMAELVDEAETTAWIKAIPNHDMPDEIKQYYTFHDSPFPGRGYNSDDDSDYDDMDNDDNTWSCSSCGEKIDQDSTYYFQDEPYCESCEGEAVEMALRDDVTFCVTHNIFTTDNSDLKENYLQNMGYKVASEEEHPVGPEHEIIRYQKGVKIWDEVMQNAKNQLQLQFEEQKKEREEKQPRQLKLPQTNPTEETAALKQAGEGRYLGNPADGWWEAPDNFDSYTSEDFYKIFKYAPWKHSYGGPLWAEVARTVNEMQKTTQWDKLVVLIDHYHDLGHNTGKLLDKFPEWHQWFKKLLDMKAQKNSVRYLLPKASKPVQSLVTEFLRVHGRDWREDEEKKPQELPDTQFHKGEQVIADGKPAVIRDVSRMDLEKPLYAIVYEDGKSRWAQDDELQAMPSVATSSLGRPFSKKAAPTSRYWIAPDGTEFEVSGIHPVWILNNGKVLKKYGIDPKQATYEIHNQMMAQGWTRISTEGRNGFQIEVADLRNLPPYLDDFIARNFQKGDEILLGNGKEKGVFIRNPFPTIQKAVNKELSNPVNSSLKQAAINGDVTNKILMSIHNNGGATYNLSKGDMSGTPNYSVSIYPTRERIVDGVDFDTLEGFLDENEDLLRDPNNSVGAWTNNGKVYLDIVLTVPDRDKAIELGRQNNQIAIWDLQNSKEISTGGTGGGNIRSFSKKEIIKVAIEQPLSEVDQNAIAAASSPAYVMAVNNYAEAVKRGHSKDRAIEYAIESVANVAEIDPKKLVEFINNYVN